MALATTTATTAATTVTVIVAVIVCMVVTMAATAATVVMIVIMAVIMVMTMIVTAATSAVHMAMGQLFGGRGTHVLDLDLEAQGHASQGMIAVHLDELLGHLDDGHRAVAVVGLGHKSIPFRHFHTVEQLAGHFLHQILVVLAIGLVRRQGDSNASPTLRPSSSASRPETR